MNDRPPIQRTHYFTGEALLTTDFTCEQQYNIEMLALLNSSLRTYGIASGLEVYWQQGSQARQVTISPGMAIDRLGRQIVLTSTQVIRLDDVPNGATVFLTIRYHEVYGDYVDQASAGAGAAGYKRIIQQPLIEYPETLQEPGLNILLAVIAFSSQGGINELTYRAGRYERRYVGSRLGSVNLVTEGSGIVTGTGTRPAVFDHPEPHQISLTALKETDTSGDYLNVDARRSQFDGMLTTRANFGIGNDHPQANLQVDAITFKGDGTLTTLGTLLTFAPAIHPPLQPGDIVIPDVPVGAAPPVPRQAVIASATDNPAQYRIQQAFNNDLLLPYHYTYLRSTLARFAAGNNGTLLAIGYDGSVGLGLQAAGQTGVAGPNALTITTDRRIGIALNTDSGPQATLDVNGSLRSDSLTCNGTVKAQSFEGNGSKLQNLPILSYWTKQNVSSPVSPIYYNQGNVGVQMTDPPGSLSVGTGLAFIGAGVISADASDGGDKTKLTGFQSLFKSQVRLGDSILIGTLMPQLRQIKTVVSNTELVLTDQFPMIIEQSTFEWLPAGSAVLPGNANLIGPTPPPPPPPSPPPPPALAASANTTGGSASGIPDAKPGTGTVSSNGTQIKGVDTQFTKELQAGDWVIIPKFTPNTNTSWLVKEVTDDTTLKVINTKGVAIPANVSAYMVMPALIGLFQNNSDNLLAISTTTPPPAMLIVSNGPDADAQGVSPNTVAINLTLDQVDPTYALQVNGDVNFSGSSSFDKLTAKQLSVTEWAKISGAGDGGKVLTVGSTATPGLLTVTQSNVVVGTSAGSNLLEVGGNAHATGQLLADDTVQGKIVKATDSLQAPAMNVSAVAIDGSGNVTLFANRTSGTLSANNTTYSAQANTDGMVVASIGTFDPNFQTAFAGVVTCQTSQNGSPTSVNYAAASTQRIEVDSGKKGKKTYYQPQYGFLCVPVRKGEQWSLTLTFATQLNPAPTVTFYWVPLGPNNGQASKVAVEVEPKSLETGGAAAVPAEGGGAAAPADGGHLSQLAQAIETMRHNLLNGGLAPSLADAQRVIDDRVGDLTRILGDATHMKDDPQARADFIKQLQNIVCSATPPGTPHDNSVDPQHIEDLIETFAQVTGHSFTPEQKALLDAGVRALVQINDSPENRNDLNLIRNNINLFLDNLETALGSKLDTGQRRLLTRALARIVGNGTQDPSAGNGTPPPTTGGNEPPPSTPAPGPAPADTPHPAVHGFFQEIEQALVEPLENEAKTVLHGAVDKVLTERPDKAEAEELLHNTLKTVAGDALKEGGDVLLKAAVGHLLAALL